MPGRCRGVGQRSWKRSWAVWDDRRGKGSTKHPGLAGRLQAFGVGVPGFSEPDVAAAGSRCGRGDSNPTHGSVFEGCGHGGGGSLARRCNQAPGVRNARQGAYEVPRGLCATSGAAAAWRTERRDPEVICDDTQEAWATTRVSEIFPGGLEFAGRRLRGKVIRVCRRCLGSAFSLVECVSTWYAYVLAGILCMCDSYVRCCEAARCLGMLAAPMMNPRQRLIAPAAGKGAPCRSA
jgi:hypothetical protein